MDYLGKAIAFSPDGNNVAIYAPGSEEQGNSEGYVKVFRYSANTWKQLGENIEGELEGDGYIPSRNRIALSSEAGVLANGSRYNDGNGLNSGHVRVFNFLNNSWTQNGEDIDGEAPGDLFGTSVSLSHDGQTLVIGARNNEGTGQDAGHVRIYGIPEVVSIGNEDLISFTIYPNPTNDILNIQLDDSYTLLDATLYNQVGQKVKSSKENKIELSSIIPGVYLLEIHTNKGNAVQKVIIE